MAQEKNDFFAGYIEEVQAYIPTMRAGIVELRSNLGKRETIEELYRLAHIIRGASSMVGIAGLSRIAGCMENALEPMAEGRLPMTAELLPTMESAVDRIDEFCVALQQGSDVDEADLIARTEAEFNTVAGPGDLLFAEGTPPLAAGDDLFSTGPSEDDLDNELLGEFQAEAEEHLESLHQSMQYLERKVVGVVAIDSELRETIRTIRRSVHTIKGAAAVIGLTDLAAYGHLIEDVLDWLFETAVQMDQEMVLPLSGSLDMLATMIYAPDQFVDQQAELLLTRLQACMSAGEGAPAVSTGSDALSDAILEAIETITPPVDTTREAGGEGSLQGSLFSEEEKQLLREGFLEEAEEHLQHLHRSLQLLENETAERVALSPEQKEEIRKIRRAVHTIKGASAVIGLNDIAVYAHGVEDFLDWLYEGASHIDPDVVGALAESLDFLGLLVESPQAAESDRQANLLERLLTLTREHLPEELLLDEPVDLPIVPEHALVDAGLETSDEQEPEEIAPLAAAAEMTRTIRINQSQLDVLINLANELLVGISGFDQNMGLFKKALDEMEMTSRRLKDIALELETKFEVKALDQLSHHFSRIDQAVADIKTRQSFAEFDALELDRYTQLNLIIRSLNESAIDVAAIHTNLGGVYSGIGGDIGRQHRVIRELQVQMMRTRMSPMSTLSSRLSRTMRDVASRLGKRVRLVVEGERVELDRVVWEKLADPFMHLVRNAIHHGIESPEERQASNKPAIATITLDGKREGNHIVIRFSDDGQGLDFEAIREKARRFGLGTKADRMDEQELTDLIFYPGFSTKTISEISGRGVGMDVVRENVKELQGTIGVETQRGLGTTFTLRIPLTLGIVRSLLIRIGEVTYGIALNDIMDIHRLNHAEISVEEGTCQLAGETVAWHSLVSLLGVKESVHEKSGQLVLRMNAGGRTLALSIPQITGQKEIVLKGLGAHLRMVPGVSGAAVMGDGSIVPVLDIPDLIEAARRAEQDGTTMFNLEIPKTFTVMIVDDSISIRRVMSRLVTANGWSPVEAKDGLDALEQLEMEEVRPDCIILDIEMPRMNGFEFLAKLPKLPGGDTIPVIMLTSRTSVKHQEKAYQLGASAFLNKPCKDEEFVETVQRLTGHGASSLPENRREVLA